jgi:hypothetical protein
MRLKVSPKAAVQAVDILVKTGTKERVLLHSMYDKLDEDIKNEIDVKEAAHETAKQKALQAVRNQPNEVEVDLGNGMKMAMPNSQKLSALMTSMMPEPIYLGGSRFSSNIAEGRMKELEGQFAAWRDETKEVLESIFMDFTPVHAFMDAFGEFYSDPSPFGRSWRFEKYINLKRELDAKLEVLIGFYKELSDDIRSPLTYLTDQAKVCFYDFVCPLQIDSNEASLCAFMFQFSIGEKVEMVDVYNHMFGLQETTLNTAAKNKIKNAVDGINGKTNKVFGFPILAKDATTINLTIPARVTQNML